ncbi:MAG: xanthine dehydrogenase family protein subunit M [Acidobacteria bacterium]|nr:xanthine dehydrogenase family protein subunit M [Acidobacteriota bacterium]
MGLNRFEYIEASSIPEASRFLADRPEEARIYAGGTSLLLLMKQRIARPAYLVNIKKIPGLRYIDKNDGTVRIGALTTHHDLEFSPLIRRWLPVISELEPEVANIRVRSTGTIGGNLGFAEPLTDLPPVLIAMDARIKVADESLERLLPLEHLFRGYYETSLRPQELITEIQVDLPAPFFGIKYLRFSMGSDKPLVGCAVGIRIDPESKLCVDARCVLGCVGPTPLRVREAEEALKGLPYRVNSSAKAARIAATACSPLTDLRATEEYKRAIVEVLMRRAVEEAFRRASSKLQG